MLGTCCLVTGCCSARRVAEVYATSNPPGAKVWNLYDGHSFGTTPSSTYLYSVPRLFGTLKPKTVRLQLVFEEPGYSTIVREFKVTNWEFDESHARLDSNKIQADLLPLK